MDIVLVGLNHKTAPIEIRERLSFAKSDIGRFLTALKDLESISEALLLSTCNRVEILMTASSTSEAIQRAKGLLCEHHGVSPNTFESCMYVHISREAVKHLFRVASSLDSMVVGEPQILGQIKEAYRNSLEYKGCGVILNRLLHKSFSVAKRVRTETGIGDSAVSISFAAVELGKKIFGTLHAKKALLIGAGEMAELACRHLLNNGVNQITIANRTLERGMELAQKFNGRPISMGEIQECLKQVDIVISSTGAPSQIIFYEDVKGVMRARKNRPIFFIDIAVPRDIDPKVNEIGNVYVYDIDDLQGIVELNIKEREAEAIRAERIVEEETIKFENWLNTLAVVPTIVSLNQKMEGIRRCELEKTLSHLKDLSQSEREAIDRLTLSIIKKILHDPITYLKGKGCKKEPEFYINLFRQLFNLDDGMHKS
ncbi:MAG TPA: glutamyl-tRNA reductase [Syntrophaceae bacterium]|nr:glutamyl-tRNA reductase [Syntrophaceae bacterium]